MQRVCWIILIACSVCLFTGCKDAQHNNSGDAKTIYRHALDGTPRSLDPVQASSVYASFVVNTIYDTLYSYKYLARPYELKPSLAQGMPEVSEDGLVYTIRLKPGIYFADDPAFPDDQGREVVAEDFIYSIKRHYDPISRSQGAWLWQGKIAGLSEWEAAGSDYALPVEGLKAVDSHTIEIRLLSPYPQLLHTLTHAFSSVVPHEAVEHYGREFSVRPVGSGAYQLDSYDTAKAVLKRNPGYRSEPINLAYEGYNESLHGEFGLASIEGKSPPLTDLVEIHFIPEDAARWNTLNSGEVDFARIPVTQYDSVIEQREPMQLKPGIVERYHFQTSMEAGFVHTDFNMDDPAIGYHPDPEQNQRNHALRCAIVKAFDWEARNQSFYYGIGKVFPGVIPPITGEYNPNTNQEYVTRDIPGAKALLEEYGWTADNLPVLEYGYPASVTERQMFEQFRSFLGDIGYPVEKITSRSFATFADYMQAYSQRDVMLITASWTMDYPDAENTIQLFYGPNASPGANASNFDNPEYNQLYQDSAWMPFSPERTLIYQRMNDIVMQECATISGISRNFLLLWDKDINMLPDRSFLGGRFVPFIDTAQPAP